MYAAILISIETKDYSWESNFDQFETILYRRTWVDQKSHNTDKESGSRKRFCRDLNNQKVAQRTAHTQYGSAMGPTQSRRQ